ncbi:MAG TPA: YdeI/OmpD-associated family protein [Candidatus Cybelea sp.]|jgi:bifunctional DNA-binding transcriptional regulator/antitoxin component of YhaV-PrlF toxin-antitoxin module|nr:YdeI/OmpD-associated family protein [Candidatus Cybelea sp.]
METILEVVRTFRAVVEGVEGSSATYLRLTDAALKALGGRARVPVRVVINGAEHRTSIADMGLGPMIGIPAAFRRAAGIERGKRVSVSVEPDRMERTVDVPPDFAKAMKAAEHRAYDGMSYTHRKEYVQWIEAAKKPETRIRRIKLALEKLRERIERNRQT